MTTWARNREQLSHSWLLVLNHPLRPLDCAEKEVLKIASSLGMVHKDPANAALATRSKRAPRPTSTATVFQVRGCIGASHGPQQEHLTVMFSIIT